MDKLLFAITIAVGLLAFGVFTERLLGRAPDADLASETVVLNADHPVPFDGVRMTDPLPLDFSAAF